jgi:hypothetical protein
MKRGIGSVVFMLLVGLAIGWWFAPVLQAPDRYMFGNEGDGLKNYYTLSYYLQYNEGFHFTGMNYPYGEVLTFCDNQPALAFVLNWIDDNIISIQQHTVGILNVLILFSLWWAVWLLLAIMRRMNIADWVGMPASICIAFMSPQLWRMGGHFSLAYTFFVPLLWYLNIRLSHSWRWALVVVFVVFALGYIHPYYVMIGMVWVLAWAGVRLLQWRHNWRVGIGDVIRVLSAYMLGFAMYAVSSTLLDTTADRNKIPWGFYTYYAKFESAFMPSKELPQYALLNWLTPIVKVQYESYAYVGLVCLLGLVWYAMRVYQFGIRRAWRRTLNPLLNRTLNTWLVAGVLVYVYACCPFWGILAEIPERIPMLQMFRSLGRFTWVFYYTFAVFCTYHLYLVLKSARQHGLFGLSQGLWILIFGVWGLEAFVHLRVTSAHLYQPNRFANRDTLVQQLSEALQPHDVKNFQAILALPHTHIGSEKVYHDRNSYWGGIHGMTLSNATGLPFMQCQMSRTSISQTLNNLQLVADPIIEKDLLKNLPDKPILLVRDTRDDSLTAGEQFLIQCAQFLGKTDQFVQYYALDPHHPKLYQTIDYFGGRYRTLPDTAFQQNNTLYSTNKKYFSINFDELGGTALRGAGGYTTTLQKDSFKLLYEGNLPMFAADDCVAASIWWKVDTDKYGYPELVHRAYNDKNQLLGEQFISHRPAVTPQFGWVMHNGSFSIPKGTYKHQLLLYSNVKNTYILDELLLQACGAEVFGKSFRQNERAYFTFNNMAVPLK